MKAFVMKPLSYAVAVLIMAAGCSRKEGPMKWVDLRYDVAQDSYLIDAKGTESISIRVKSTDPWSVFGSGHEDWYIITPDSGEAGKTYDVTITCKENTALDDRTDTINIKSDYWTGKQFLIVQKGTAFLDFKVPGTIGQKGEKISLEILSNQNWRAEVTEGMSWLGIVGGNSGNGNLSLTLSASENSGEVRYGKVTLYDRNGNAAQSISITQDGVLLTPMVPDNGRFFVLDETAQELRIPVESNTSWKVSKKNQEEETWYRIAGDGIHEGSGEIVLDISEYPAGGGTAVRTGTLILSTETAEGVAPLTKTIRFKQSSPDSNRTEIHEGGPLTRTSITGGDGLKPGRYTFSLAPFDASTCIYLYFIWKEGDNSFAELRFWLNTSFAPMKTELSCMPYCNDVNKWQSDLLVPFDNTRPVRIGLDIRESKPDSSGNTWLYSEWLLNDVVIARATSDGIADRNGNTDTWKVPYSRLAGGAFSIWANTGAGRLEKWEYTRPIEWGE